MNIYGCLKEANILWSTNGYYWMFERKLKENLFPSLEIFYSTAKNLMRPRLALKFITENMVRLKSL
jgi:hypothetical protein